MKWVKLCIVLLGIATIVGCGANETVEETTAEITEVTKETIEVFGKIEAPEVQEIHIDFPAIVEEVLVEEGQSVKKGDVLLKLDYSQYLSEIGKIKKQEELTLTELESGKGQIAGLQAEVKSLEEEKALKSSYLSGNDYQLQTLNEKLQLIESQLELQEAQYKQGQELLKVGGISQNEVDQMELAINNLTNQKNELEDKISSYKEGLNLEISKLDASLKSVTSNMHQLQEQNNSITSKQDLTTQINLMTIEEMEDKLNYPYIKENNIVLDIDNGIIQNINCKKYSRVGTSGTTYLLSIMDASKIEVVADVPEEFMSTIQEGMSCMVVPYYDSTQSFAGKVVRIDEKAVKEDGEVLVKVHIEVEKQDDMFKPGLSVDVSFEIEG